MATLKQHLNIQTPVESFDFNTTEPYKEVFNIRKSVDNNNTFTELYATGKTAGSNEFDDFKAFVVHNTSNTVVEGRIELRDYENTTSASLDTPGGDKYFTFLLRAGEYMYLPNIRFISYIDSTSAANANPITDDNGSTRNSGNLFVDSGATLGGNVEDDSTTISVNDADYFRIGDLIQIGNNDSATATKIEIMEIVNISGTTFSVKRALNGSIVADKDAQTDATNGAVSGAKIYLPFFNAVAKKDKYTKVQTTDTGVYQSRNLLAYGRRAAIASSGIVPGSVSIKTYTKAYQELGLSGITASTDSGLTASTEYKFNITVDGGSTFTNLSFTVDASNTNFGGANGVLSKIQSSLDTQFRTSGSNLFEKKVHVEIVNGDVRFSSGSHLSSSAILLAAPSSGTTPFGVGRIPAIGSVETPISPVLPADERFEMGGVTTSEATNNFSYDNGHGSFVGGQFRGTINYESGALSLNGPPNAELAISCVIQSAHGGGNHYGNDANTIKSLAVRGTNTRISPVVELVAFK